MLLHDSFYLSIINESIIRNIQTNTFLIWIRTKRTNEHEWTTCFNEQCQQYNIEASSLFMFICTCLLDLNPVFYITLYYPHTLLNSDTRHLPLLLSSYFRYPLVRVLSPIVFIIGWTLFVYKYTYVYFIYLFLWNA